jgi:hypothetical protein
LLPKNLSSVRADKLVPEEAVRLKDTIRFDRFQAWLENSDCSFIDRFTMLEFGAQIGTRGCLSDLESTLLLYLPKSSEMMQEVRAAVLDHRRRVDGLTMRVDVLKAHWWLPFLPHTNIDVLHIHEVNRLDAWLSWMHERKLAAPTAKDYVDFAKQWDSEAPLMSIKKSFQKLNIPKVPTVEIELDQAISFIRSNRNNAGTNIRKSWPLEKSAKESELPAEWQDILLMLENGKSPKMEKCPAKKFLPTIKVALRTLCFCCNRADRPICINKETVLLLVGELKLRKNKASTINIYLSALKRFMLHLDCNLASQNTVAKIESEWNKRRNLEVPKKFARLIEVGSTQIVLGTAIDLLSEARSVPSLELRLAKLNAAVALALFALIPLRVADTNLSWGEHVTFRNGRYRLDIVTSKTGGEFHGELCDFLTPFLDALLLRGCDEHFLTAERTKAKKERRHLFSHSNSRHMSEKRVKNLWDKHVGCGPHIARSLIHTELGEMGPSGVEMALSLCVQRDPRTAKFYQGKAMNDALLIQGNLELLSGFTDEEISRKFTALENDGRPFSFPEGDFLRPRREVVRSDNAND